MINILYNVFEEILDDYPTKEIGNKIYIKLDDNRRVELSFYNTWSADTYDSIRLELFHKENGKLHCQIIKFKDIFRCIQDLTHPNKIGKHIWYNNNKYRWYGKPTKEDIETMNIVLINYIETWS